MIVPKREEGSCHANAKQLFSAVFKKAKVLHHFLIFHLKTKSKSIGNLFKRYESQREEIL